MTMRVLAALALLVGMSSGLVDARPPQHRAATDWTSIAVATPDGGVRIGNPAARMQLVEYGSYTCPHCAAFAKEAFPLIRDRYVRTGKVSFEFRAALRDGVDMTAALVARCGGPTRFYGTALAIFDAQADWEQRATDYMQKLTTADAAATPGAQIDRLASASGLAALAAKRGVTAPLLTRCIGDPGLRDTLTKAASDAWNVRQIGATPTFYLNGDKLDGVYGWAALEPNLIAALKN